MLNTSLHNPNVRDRPPFERFVSMNRGINNGSDLPEEQLRVRGAPHPPPPAGCPDIWAGPVSRAQSQGSAPNGPPGKRLVLSWSFPGSPHLKEDVQREATHFTFPERAPRTAQVYFLESQVLRLCVRAANPHALCPYSSLLQKGGSGSSTRLHAPAREPSRTQAPPPPRPSTEQPPPLPQGARPCVRTGLPGREQPQALPDQLWGLVEDTCELQPWVTRPLLTTGT